MKKAFLFILLWVPIFCLAQFEREQKLTVIGGMNGRIQKPFLLQSSKAGIWQSGKDDGFLAMLGYSQYVADTSEFHPRASISIEAGCFSHFNNWLLSTIAVGYSAQGWFIRPALLLKVGEKFMIELYYQTKLIGIGFIVDFKH